MNPCPNCKTDEHLVIYTYDSGWRHVECLTVGCYYLGPGEGSARAAIAAHNHRTAHGQQAGPEVK